MNRLYYNIPLLKKAGIEKAPTELDDEFFAALDKLKASGVIPLALGGNAQQYRWTWDAVMSAVGGKEQWLAVYVRRDPKAMKNDTERKAFETFRRLRNYIDKGSSGRTWQATTNLVASGQAGMQILGDWGKAELDGGRQEAGRRLRLRAAGRDLRADRRRAGLSKAKDRRSRKGAKAAGPGDDVARPSSSTSTSSTARSRRAPTCRSRQSAFDMRVISRPRACTARASTSFAIRR